MDAVYSYRWAAIGRWMPKYAIRIYRISTPETTKKRDATRATHERDRRRERRAPSRRDSDARTETTLPLLTRSRPRVKTSAARVESRPHQNCDAFPTES
eukprot:5812482-Pyramimonas_sp.AAC.1